MQLLKFTPGGEGGWDWWWRWWRWWWGLCGGAVDLSALAKFHILKFHSLHTPARAPLQLRSAWPPWENISSGFNCNKGVLCAPKRHTSALQINSACETNTLFFSLRCSLSLSLSLWFITSLVLWSRLNQKRTPRTLFFTRLRHWGCEFTWHFKKKKRSNSDPWCENYDMVYGMYFVYILYVLFCFEIFSGCNLFSSKYITEDVLTGESGITIWRYTETF